ncbi:Dephospho-CoA kinase [hydrothermal vent metagenome]|uniref:Dephospho-CoA kinase n=1 Tax=hydrothermal vent metagenome TaxID=652676 RepID=A0A1W1BXA6_9ZZZZ
MPFEYAVALTGGIATGKSTTTMLLSLYGFRFIDADKIAHSMLDTHSNKIAQLFGDEFVADGRVDRTKLGNLIFSDSSKRVELESLLHPLIYQEIERLSIEQDRYQKPYIIDIPLFFEGGRYPIERSVVIYTPKDKQLERLVARDGYTQDEALKRIESQMDIEEKRRRATFVIDNSGDLKQLQRECDRVKEEILSSFEATQGDR